MGEAKPAWTTAARPVLERVAGEYDATISYKELAEEVQERSGIRTRMLIQHWIGDVLGEVARNCHGRGEPLLSALCVHADGSVGVGYAWAIAQTYGGDVPEDLDMHAAVERLECYRHFGAELPPDGGSSKLTPQVAADAIVPVAGLCPQLGLCARRAT